MIHSNEGWKLYVQGVSYETQPPDFPDEEPTINEVYTDAGWIDPQLYDTDPESLAAACKHLVDLKASELGTRFADHFIASLEDPDGQILELTTETIDDIIEIVNPNHDEEITMENNPTDDTVATTDLTDLTDQLLPAVDAQRPTPTEETAAIITVDPTADLPDNCLLAGVGPNETLPTQDIQEAPPTDLASYSQSPTEEPPPIEAYEEAPPTDLEPGEIRMNWITIHHVCGHSQEHDIDDDIPNDEHRAIVTAEQARLCLDCWKAERDIENEAAKDEAKIINAARGLPTIKTNTEHRDGTPRDPAKILAQVRWAELERMHKVTALEAFIDLATDDTIPRLPGLGIPESKRLITRALKDILSDPRAWVWLDSRDKNIGDMLREKMMFYKTGPNNVSRPAAQSPKAFAVNTVRNFLNS
jgi:hypothetical protein